MNKYSKTKALPSMNIASWFFPYDTYCTNDDDDDGTQSTAVADFREQCKADLLIFIDRDLPVAPPTGRRSRRKD